jgi:phage tail sheath gpL-like
MYLKNSSGANDIAYQYRNTMFILMYMRYSFVNTIKTKYSRARLADSADRIRAGIKVITPALGKAEAVALARLWEADGLLENIEQFKSEIICRRSSSNPNRLEWILPPDLVNQFIVGSGDMPFSLQRS